MWIIAGSDPTTPSADSKEPALPVSHDQAFLAAIGVSREISLGGERARTAVIVTIATSWTPKVRNVAETETVEPSKAKRGFPALRSLIRSHTQNC